MNTKLLSATQSIQTAENWASKGQPAWVARCLHSALMNYLSIAVCETDSEATALEWLRRTGVGDLLSRYAVNVATIQESVRKGEMPASVLGGAYGHIVVAHLCCLLGVEDRGSYFVQLANAAEIQKITSPFWRTYAYCLEALYSGTSVPRKELKVARGQERYWNRYVSLMFVAMTDNGLQAELEAVDASFLERNSDASIKDDIYEIEGTAQCPARWDFRKSSILTILNIKWQQRL